MTPDGDVLIAVGGVGTIIAVGLVVAGRLERSLMPSRRPDRQTTHRRRYRSPWSRSTDRRRRRSTGADDTRAARWCDDLARRIHGGDSLLVALVQATSGPVEIVDGLAAATGRGVPLAVALAAHRGRSATIDHVLAVLITCAEVGSPAAPALDRLAAVLADRAAVGAERRTHSAQAQWSATVLTVLPGAAALMMAITSPAMRHAFLSPIGLTAAALGVAFNGAGWWWMRRIVGRVAS